MFDVLPDNCMNSFTAEDLRLLLNGVGDINVSTLISYTTFNDESSESSDKLLKFKRWFWSIVEKMSNLERQDLVLQRIHLLLYDVIYFVSCFAGLLLDWVTRIARI